ncbi:hypothetical protein LTR86_004747 [Recurvomyces mirabilis]|nr:hypothetical protein LTR86_004747 [Recurvomyces mirabilis]
MSGNGTIPSPYTTWHNYTYATSCAYSDPGCLSTCGQYFSSCESDWAIFTQNATAIATLTSTSLYLDPQVSTIAQITKNATTVLTQTLIRDSTSFVEVASTVVGLASGSQSLSTTYSPFTYTSYIYSYSNTLSTATQPGCSSPGNAMTACISGCNPNYCTITGGTVDLLYWPVATTSLHTIGSGLNASLSTQIIPITHAPNVTRTTVYKGITMTSPSVYVSFDSAWAFDECSQPVGRNHSGSIIAMLPDQVSSIHGSLGPQMVPDAPHFHGTWIPASMNYTNLAMTPVPLSVYLDQPSCFDSFCSTIYTDYKPVLSVPQQVLSLDPAWKNCDVFWQGVYDPPKALQPTDVEATPTTPAGQGTTSTAASPSSTPTSPTASATALPVSVSTSTSAAARSSASSPLQNSATAVAPAPYSSSSSSSAALTQAQSSVGAVKSAQSSSAKVAMTTTGKVSGASSGDTVQATSQNSPSNALGVLTQAQQSSSDPSGPAKQTTSAVSSQQDPTAQSSPNTASRNSGNPAVDGTDPVQEQRTSTPISAVADAADPATVTAPQATVTAGGQAYTVLLGASSSAAIVQISGTSVTLTEGASTVVLGQTISVGLSGLVVGSQTVPVITAPAPTVSSQAVVTAGGVAYTASVLLSGSAAVVAGQTLSIGGSPITISGATISAASTGLVIAQSGSTNTAVFEAASPTTRIEAVITLGSQTVTAYRPADTSNVVAVGGTTLTVGGEAKTVRGAVVSAGTNGLSADGRVVPFSTVVAADPTQRTAHTSGGSHVETMVQAILTAAGQTITAYRVSTFPDAVAIDGTTLSVGGSALTLSGHTYSAQSSGIVEDGTLAAWSTTIVTAQSSQTLASPGSSLGSSSTGSISIPKVTSGPTSASGSAKTSAIQSSEGVQTSLSGRLGLGSLLGVLIMFML